MDIDPDAKMIELAWGIIANVDGGNWENQAESWQDAAKAWSSKYDKWRGEQMLDEEIEPGAD